MSATPGLDKAARMTAETLISLVTQMILKHEKTVLEVMLELKAENARLRELLRHVADEPNDSLSGCTQSARSAS